MKNLLWYGPSCSYKDNLHEGPSKRNHSPNRNESLRKNPERSTHNDSIYPKDL